MESEIFDYLAESWPLILLWTLLLTVAVTAAVLLLGSALLRYGPFDAHDFFSDRFEDR